MNTHFDSIELHQGKALTAAMARYYTLLAALKEIIQNSIDNEATRIHVLVDFKKSFVRILANGKGTTLRDFADALKNVFASSKVQAKTKYGRFGIGLFAPGDKCKEYCFTARDPETRLYNRWTFVKDDIESSREVRIPRTSAEELCEGFTTESFMKGLISDRSRMNCTASELAHDVRTEFSIAIREQKIVIEIEFASEKGEITNETVSEFAFQGDALEPFANGKGEHSRADFLLFIAPLTGSNRKGEVYAGITEDPFRISLLRVLSNAPEGILPKKFIQALEAGVFAGEVISTGCTLNDNRRTWRRNDALRDFCGYLKNWWEEVGSKHYQEIEEENESTRFQDLGKRALESLARTLSDPKVAEMYKGMVKNFQVGTVGEEHFSLDPSLHLGPQEVKSIEVRAKKEGQGKGGSGDPDKQKEHSPLTVTGRKGQHRAQVRDNSLGLQITYSEMAGSSRMYRLDSLTGVLEVNIRHPYWEALEDSDSSLVQYQTMLIFNALVGHSLVDAEEEERYKLSVLPLMSLWVTHTRLSS